MMRMFCIDIVMLLIVSDVFENVLVCEFFVLNIMRLRLIIVKWMVIDMISSSSVVFLVIGWYMSW